MKYTAALIAAAVGANAWSTTNVTVTTEVVDKYVTYCPGPTHITHGSKVYTVTEATTLTITDCPCTVTKPVITSSAVICQTCNGGNFPNTTAPIATGTGSAPPGVTVTPTQSQPTAVPTAGAGKAAAFSGAGLAGIVAMAAFVL
ncbi:hypothetical protein EsDP_00005248 [Epichloe bromicola]|uniref:Mmc protein n=1 Tax=Epichloe bromicola TaxID=79588 RepID=A0ABQ0CU41_9HYPO